VFGARFHCSEHRARVDRLVDTDWKPPAIGNGAVAAPDLIREVRIESCDSIDNGRRSRNVD
jgi:hypothetical protein